MLEKKREHKANKTTKKLVLLKLRITVEATLWWKNMYFYKVRLFIYSLYLRCNTIGGYHGTIPWVDTTYDTIDKSHVWMNTMGGYIPWFTYNTMGE